MKLNTIHKRRVRLNNEQTKPEKRFKEELLSNGINYKQNIYLNGFYADFLINGFLIIEIDGGYHSDRDQSLYDAGRTYILKKEGYIVQRFTNNEVTIDSEKCIEIVKLLLLKYKGKKTSRKARLINKNYGRKYVQNLGKVHKERPIDKPVLHGIVVIPPNK